jgi:mannose-6-phosphate isomerase-like protein (cupin superfamily)
MARGKDVLVAYPGQELVDGDTEAQLRFVEVDPAVVRMELSVSDGWSAGPLHVHPHQTERLRVVDGVFRGRLADEVRALGAGETLEVPPRTPHTIELASRQGELEVEFRPALRTAELFETMFSAGPRRPPGFVPGALRAFAESRGFADEIRYLWPRRVLVGLGAAALVLAGRSARKASRRAASSSSSA